jgi:[methyl-Co(III) methylamine-specific corrinoid protein]:coenzyme M methyltransferase
MARSGAEIIDIDWMVDMQRAVGHLDSAVVCGNIDPVAILLQGTPAQVRDGVRANAAAGGRRWISAAGCEVPDGTPAVNLLAHHDALREIAGEG